jgi:hypothetical protein
MRNAFNVLVASMKGRNRFRNTDVFDIKRSKWILNKARYAGMVCMVCTVRILLSWNRNQWQAFVFVFIENNKRFP